MIVRRLAHLGYKLAYVGLRIGSLLLRPHTRGVKCVLCIENEILLVRHSYGRRRWDLPGGFVRRSESFESAARRELAEELGCREGAAFTDLGEVLSDFDGRHETLHGFRVEVADRRFDIQGYEIAEATWFPLDALPVKRAAIVDKILALDARFVRS